jgi:hypothetical protein
VSATRIHFAAGLDGSEPAWRKLVNTISLDVFKADVVLLAGGLGAGDDKLAEWLALAAERLDAGDAPLYVLPDAGDGAGLGALLGAGGGPRLGALLVAGAGDQARAARLADPRGRPVALPGGLQLLAWPVGTSPEAGAALTASVTDSRRTVLLADAAPGEIDRVLHDLQPLLALHARGAEGKTWVGDTLCLTPVGPVKRNAVRGWVIDVGERGVVVARPVQV